MRILLWHVHGSWTTAFVQGPHTYLVPVTPRQGPGRPRPRRHLRLARLRRRDVPPEQLRDTDIDLVVLQRPPTSSTSPGAGWAAAPAPTSPPSTSNTTRPAGPSPTPATRPLDHRGLTIVHVTYFNQLFWDCAKHTHHRHRARHRRPRPPQWTGHRERAAVVVNEPLRRGRTTGTDLLARFARAAPLDVFGMRTHGIAHHLGLPEDRCHARELVQNELHRAMAACRMYLHPVRWTSLGLSLLEAMHLGMPVVALATTEVVEAVPPEAGVVSNRPDVLLDAVRGFIAEPGRAREAGRAARTAALARYGLPRFLDDWDRLIKEVTR
ncbi:glycosyltransferase [Streptomyces olivoverticillatus]